MNKVLSIIGFILIFVTGLIPITQFPLVSFKDKAMKKCGETMKTWGMVDRYSVTNDIKADWFHNGEIPIVNEKANGIVKDEDLPKELLDYYSVTGITRGRSHPMKKGVGPEVVVDGYTDPWDESGIYSHWSFYKEFYPVELTITKEQPVSINYISIIPRWEWRVGYYIHVVQKQAGDESVVPMHYHGCVPVKYHFSDKRGIGVKLILEDPIVAGNNSWAAPIFEVGAGYEVLKNQ